MESFFLKKGKKSEFSFFFFFHNYKFTSRNSDYFFFYSSVYILQLFIFPSKKDFKDFLCDNSDFFRRIAGSDILKLCL